MYRLRKRHDGKLTVAELHDDLAGGVAARCRYVGKPEFARIEGECPPDGAAWRAAPNRRVLPTSWRLETEGGDATVFSHDVLRKTLNPWGRTLFTVEREGSGGELRVVDAVPDGVGRALNLAREDWALVHGDETVARLGFACRPEEGPAHVVAGPLGRLRRAVGSALAHDRALVSLGEAHALKPHEALVLMLLCEALTETV